MRILNLKIFITLGIIAALFPLYHYWENNKFEKAFKPRDKPVTAKILFVSGKRIGENEFLERLKIAADRKNIDLRVVIGRVDRKTYDETKDPVQKAAQLFKPDLMFAIEDNQKSVPGISSYLVLSVNLASYINYNAQGKPTLLFNDHYKFDALLPTFKEIEPLKIALEKAGKKHAGFPWYFTSYITDYVPANPKKMLYAGGRLWDQQRSSDRYKELFSMLDQTGYFEVCGLKEKWLHTPRSYIGFIPMDGKSIISKSHDAGVSLILHSLEHLESAAPTSRIFEAAAANTVIISDRHPFILEHFADNVLYVNTELEAAAMFKQIDDHMHWILANPAQAQQMAANCNAIFKSKFSLEDQLDKLLLLHRSITDPKKNS